MSRTRTIRLEGESPADRADNGWWVDGNVITIRDERWLSVYRLPKGCRSVVLNRLSDGHAALSLGGFTSTTIIVRGPADIINQIRAEVL